MKLESSWTASAPALMPVAAKLPARCDVAVVGRGFTGLSAAFALISRGASVLMLEAGERVSAGSPVAMAAMSTPGQRSKLA